MPAPALGPAALIQGDALCLPLADESVDLIVTSPPYFGLRSYTDQGEHYTGQLGSEPTPAEFLTALWAATAEMKRVLKPGGSIFVNLGDTYYSGKGEPTQPDEKSPARRPGKRALDGPMFGVQRKSLTLLPEAYRLGCTGMLAALGRDYVHRELAAQVTKALMRDVALGVLTLAEAEDALDCALDCALEDAAGLLGGPDPGLNLIARSVTIWNKPNSLPESVRDRPRRSHEDWVHLTKQPRYYSALDEIREPYSENKPWGVRTAGKAGAGISVVEGRAKQTGLGDTTANPLGKLPGSVWNIPSEPLRTPEYMIPRHPGDMRPRWVMTGRDAWVLLRDGGFPPASAWPRDDTRGELRTAPDHYAAFPSEWPRRLILGFSPPGICTGCGEGRVLVVGHGEYRTSAPGGGPRHTPVRRPEPHGGHGGQGSTLGFVRDMSILGHACACTPYTDHPGTGGSSGPRHGDAVADGDGYPIFGTGNRHNDLRNRPKVGGWREYHLDGWTPPPARPAVVLDPFAGTGTTIMAARALGRYGVGMDLSADYLRLAGWRVWEGPGVQRVRDRTWPPPPKPRRARRKAGPVDGVQLHLAV